MVRHMYMHAYVHPNAVLSPGQYNYLFGCAVIHKSITLTYTVAISAIAIEQSHIFTSPLDRSLVGLAARLMIRGFFMVRKNAVKGTKLISPVDLGCNDIQIDR